MRDSDNGLPDGREDEVADVARRAAMAASARQHLAREPGGDHSASDVDQEMVNRLGLAIERIEAASTNFAGAMLFHGADGQALVSLMPDFGSEESRRTMTRVGTAVKMEIDLLADSSIGPYRDSLISTQRGALLVNVIGQDVLVVSLAGSPPDVAPTWKAIAIEREQMAEAAEHFFLEP